jgi:hypothetical protein
MRSRPTKEGKEETGSDGDAEWIADDQPHADRGCSAKRSDGGRNVGFAAADRHVDERQLAGDGDAGHRGEQQPGAVRRRDAPGDEDGRHDQGPDSSAMATTAKTEVSWRDASPPKKSEAPQPVAAAAASRTAITVDPKVLSAAPANVTSPEQARSWSGGRHRDARSAVHEDALDNGSGLPAHVDNPA